MNDGIDIYSRLGETWKFHYNTLQSLIFCNSNCGKTHQIYKIIADEVKRLCFQYIKDGNDGQEKAQKIVAACRDAHEATSFAQKQSNEIDKDATFAIYLLAYTRDALKINRNWYSFFTVANSWQRLQTEAEKLLKLNQNLDRFIDEFLLLNNNCVNVDKNTTTIIDNIFANNFQEFKQKTHSHIEDSTYKLKLQSTMILNNRKIANVDTASNILILNVVGCQGVSGMYALQRFTWSNMQQPVANQMNNNAAQFNIMLGDNIYDYGVYDTRDYQSFYSNFHELYNKLSFMILGNHDYGIGSGAPGRKGNLRPWQKAATQIAHTSKDRNKWCMPKRYYVVETDCAVFYYIDSNTYIFDERQRGWLQYQRNSRKNQTNKWHILCSHHPLESYGKRGFGGDNPLRHIEEQNGGKAIPPEGTSSNDIDKYSNKLGEEPQTVEEHACALGMPCSECGRSQSMSYALRNTLHQQDIYFNIVLAAHDHYFSAGFLADNPFKNTFQVIVGCGGKEVKKNSIKYEKIITRAPHNIFGSDKIFGAERYGFLEVKIKAQNINLKGIDENGQLFYINKLKLNNLAGNRVMFDNIVPVVAAG